MAITCIKNSIRAVFTECSGAIKSAQPCIFLFKKFLTVSIFSTIISYLEWSDCTHNSQLLWTCWSSELALGGQSCCGCSNECNVQFIINHMHLHVPHQHDSASWNIWKLYSQSCILGWGNCSYKCQHIWQSTNSELTFESKGFSWPEKGGMKFFDMFAVQHSHDWSTLIICSHTWLH